MNEKNESKRFEILNEILFESIREKNKIKGKKQKKLDQLAYHQNSRPLARLPPPATHVRNRRTRLRVLKPPVKVLVNCTLACE
jgi:TATA-binding protein-associated factor Taf7